MNSPLLDLAVQRVEALDPVLGEMLDLVQFDGMQAAALGLFGQDVAFGRRLSRKDQDLPSGHAVLRYYEVTVIDADAIPFRLRRLLAGLGVQLQINLLDEFLDFFHQLLRSEERRVGK